jgi:hypothetical protein
MAARCDGSDPRVTYWPPLACDPRALDASTLGDGGACAGVTTSDITFTAAACRAFADAEAAAKVAYESSTRQPRIVEPSNGDALTPDAWSIFVWAKGASAQLGPLDRLKGLIEAEAHALTPLSGDGYVIDFTQGCTEVVRAMVTTTFWAPDPASWSLLTATTGPVTVRVYWVKFSSDGITSGPVASDPITITMTK